MNLSVWLPASVEDVWPLIINADEFRGWYAFGGAHIDPVVGGRVEFRWDEHGVFLGRVQEVVREQRFSFLLALEPNSDLESGGATLVAFELSRDEESGKCLFTVRQSGYDELHASLGSAQDLAAQDRQSWEAGLELLAARCTTL
ncbi:MAG: SRPBCC domain-containing protein [Gulosibacter sp.]|uniref:SRPBCC domain-containing protein n=1 Tax=Gulosibacter sp. TaxID=2817531 RepID=UPI003F90836B